MGGGVLQPEQVVRLDALADLDGVVHAPELVDVAHQVDVGADAPRASPAPARPRPRRVGSLPHCIFIWRKPMSAQPRAGLGQVVHRMLAHQGAAGVRRRRGRAAPPEQRAHRAARRLALEVPAGHVDRRQREGEDARPGPSCPPAAAASPRSPRPGSGRRRSAGARGPPPRPSARGVSAPPKNVSPMPDQPLVGARAPA